MFYTKIISVVLKHKEFPIICYNKITDYIEFAKDTKSITATLNK